MNNDTNNRKLDLIGAALSLAAVENTHAAILPIPSTTPQLYVGFGEAQQLRDLADEYCADRPDEPTEREALIACLGDDAATLSAINPDDEMAQTMREAIACIEQLSYCVELYQGKYAEASGQVLDLRAALASKGDTGGDLSAEEQAHAIGKAAEVVVAYGQGKLSIADAYAALATAPRAAIPAPADHDALYMAAIKCGHKIDDETVTLYRDPNKEGNALSQLADRLAAAIPADGSSAEDARRKRLNFILGQCIHNQVVAQQAAWIEWQHGNGADAAMQWIENGLIGPGHIPKHDGKSAQEYFDANVDNRMEPTAAPTATKDRA